MAGRPSQVRAEVLDALQAGEVHPSDHAQKTGRAVSAITSMMRRLIEEGVAEKVGYGTYRLATGSDMVKPNGNGHETVAKAFKRSLTRDAKLERALNELCPKGIAPAKLGALLQWLELSKELAE